MGLAVNGQNGVEDVLDLLRVELDSAMAIAGCKTMKQITENRVRYESEYLMPRVRVLERLDANIEEDDAVVEHVVVVDDPRDDEERISPDQVVEVLVPTGEDGLAKFPKGSDGVDECGKTVSPWCKTVNSDVVEVVRAPPRITREVRIVPEVAKVLNRNIKADIARRDYLKNRCSNRKSSIYAQFAQYCKIN
ncbi:uncharacterized protein LOC5565205 [Aedes aegypti]|uniref:FMN-dependent dehydrogenase domain-containing protein n=1 Tax=Aedes aegypti TaxID=7159 RepID=A0A1S4F8A8_AEDAE|nr:uncharacterized protein LOC5565205 [Aedes aegypti]